MSIDLMADERLVWQTSGRSLVTWVHKSPSKAAHVSVASYAEPRLSNSICPTACRFLGEISDTRSRVI